MMGPQIAFHLQDPISRRYSKALGLLDVEPEFLKNLSFHLGNLVNILQGDPWCWKLLTKNTISSSQKKNFFKDVFARSSYPKEVQNLVFLLLRYGHLEFLPKILDEVRRKLNPQVPVFFFWADSLGKALGEVLAKELPTLWEKNIIFQSSEDRTLLRGWVLLWGHYRLDGSLKKFLNQVERRADSLSFEGLKNFLGLEEGPVECHSQ